MNSCPECDAPMYGAACRCGYKIKAGETWKQAHQRIMETPKTSREVAVAKIAEIRQLFPKYKKFVND